MALLLWRKKLKVGSTGHREPFGIAQEDGDEEEAVGLDRRGWFGEMVQEKKSRDFLMARERAVQGEWGRREVHVRSICGWQVDWFYVDVEVSSRGRSGSPKGRGGGAHRECE